MPRASIIVPAYNAARYIEETLLSIANQTMPDFECIIINDGSTDDTVACAERIKDPRFRIITIENSGGPSVPRNVGLDAAVGDYIFMFDSDDLMSPCKLEVCVSAMDACPSAGWAFSNFKTIDEKGSTLKENFLSEYESLYNIISPSKNQTHLIDNQVLFDAIVKINFVGTSSVVLRRSKLTSDDLFDETLKNSDDRVFWVKYSKKHSAIFIDKILHMYRIQGNAISMRRFDKRAPSKISGLKNIKALCDTPRQKKYVDLQLYESYLMLANCLRREKKPGAVRALINAARYGLGKKWFIALGAIFVEKFRTYKK